ncbi:unnamed protein product [Prunus armeniaca]
MEAAPIALTKVETRYPIIENLTLTLVVLARRLRLYFQAHLISILTNQPFQQVPNRLEGIPHQVVFPALPTCITPEEGREVLPEIHEGVCGDHSTSRTMAIKAIHLGYFCPSLKINAQNLG